MERVIWDEQFLQEVDVFLENVLLSNPCGGFTEGKECMPCRKQFDSEKYDSRAADKLAMKAIFLRDECMTSSFLDTR